MSWRFKRGQSKRTSLLHACHCMTPSYEPTLFGCFRSGRFWRKRVRLVFGVNRQTVRDAVVWQCLADNESCHFFSPPLFLSRVTVEQEKKRWSWGWSCATMDSCIMVWLASLFLSLSSKALRAYSAENNSFVVFADSIPCYFASQTESYVRANHCEFLPISPSDRELQRRGRHHSDRMFTEAKPYILRLEPQCAKLHIMHDSHFICY